MAGTIRAHGFTNETLQWRAWLDLVALDQATPEQLEVLEESHPKARSSDYYRFLVHQPRILRERSTAFNAIMYAPGGLPRAERELAATVVSRVNGCVYCASVHEAAEQSERLSVPPVREPRSLGDVMDRWPKDRRLYVAAERRGVPQMAGAIRADGTPAAILIGPEGGFEPAELDHLAQLGFATLVGLGPRILRADTAAAAAMALWQALSQPALAERPGHAHIA